MLNIVIFGAPGSGKGTQSELIVSKYGLHHISTGDVLREEMKKRTELGILAEGYVEKGQLIPDELIIKVLAGILDAYPKVKGFIFDGFPRTIAQGEALEKMVRQKNSNVASVLCLYVDEPILINRLLNRGKDSGRSDDALEVIQSRLDVYRTQTEPLKEYYRKKGKLFTIKGDQSIEDVFEQITEVLDRLSFQ